MCCWEFEIGPTQIPRGGTDLEKGYGDVRPWRPPFHASSAARNGPISSKRVRLQDPLQRKFRNFSLTASIFTQIVAHKPPNLEIFSSQAPKFWNFPLTSPPFQRQMSVRKPHTSEIRAAHPYLKKKLSAPQTNINFQRKHYTNWPTFGPKFDLKLPDIIFFSKFS